MLPALILEVMEMASGLSVGPEEVNGLNLKLGPEKRLHLIHYHF